MSCCNGKGKGKKSQNDSAYRDYQSRMNKVIGKYKDRKNETR